MYAITKLSSKSQTLISEITAGNKSRALPVSIALARLIANKLALPTSEVECIDNFFNTQHSVVVQARLSILNDIILLDLTTVLDLIKRFYAFRYLQISSPKHVLLKPDSAVLDFFRITRSFDIATLEAIQNNATLITELTTRFIDLIDELKEDLT